MRELRRFGRFSAASAVWCALWTGTALQAAPPGAPTLTWPPKGAVLGSNRVDLTWSGDAHDRYEIHVGSHNTPASVDGWNSGVRFVGAPGVTTAETGPLTPGQTYFVFIRLGNSEGWGPWSAAGRNFHVAGELPTEPWFIAGADGSQWPHTLCHNPDRNEYLIAYNDKKVGKRWSISYWRLNSLGQKIGSEMTITSDTPLDGVHAPVALYNSVNKEYFIAYYGWNEEPSLHDEIWGQRIDPATGAPIGPSQHYANWPLVLEIAAGYASESNVYIIAWHHNAGGQADVAALRLNAADATPIGGPVNLTATENDYSARPFIDYNPTSDEFLIAYQVSKPPDQWDLYARRVHAATGTVSAVLPLATSPQGEHNGAVLWVPELSRYLLAYEQGFTVWGQYLLADGTPSGNRFRIDREDTRGGVPGLAWSPQHQEFLVSWMSCCSYANFARRISPAGTPVTEPFRITGSLEGIGNWNPEPVWNPNSGEYLIAWFNSYNDVWVRRNIPFAPPAPDTTPPEAVTSLTLTRDGTAMHLTWTNPATPDFAGTLIRFKGGGLPAGPEDGQLLIDAADAPGTTGSFVHAPLIPGTWYYAAFAYDAALNYAPATTASATILPDYDGDGDVDLSDFAHLQVCLGGDAIDPAPGCEDADMSHDGDVDSGDLNLFLPCLGGAGLAPGC